MATSLFFSALSLSPPLSEWCREWNRAKSGTNENFNFPLFHSFKEIHWHWLDSQLEFISCISCRYAQFKNSNEPKVLLAQENWNRFFLLFASRRHSFSLVVGRRGCICQGEFWFFQRSRHFHFSLLLFNINSLVFNLQFNSFRRHSAQQSNVG